MTSKDKLKEIENLLDTVEGLFDGVDLRTRCIALVLMALVRAALLISHEIAEFHVSYVHLTR